MIKFSELKKFDSFVIQCHDNPDPDAFACAFALSEYFKGLKKKAEMIYGGFAPASKPNMLLMSSRLGIEARFVPKAETPDFSGKGALLIVVDGQYGAGNVRKFGASNVAVIDHHIPETPATLFTDIRPFLGSCSTLVWLLLKKEGFDFAANSKVATALWYGLYTDTASLAEISHPFDKDMRDKLGYDKPLIKELKNCNFTIKDLETAGKSLSNPIADAANGAALFQAEPCDPNILGVISDTALQADTVDNCVVFCETGGGAKLSVRSCVKEVMANELAARLCEGGGSGGGHADKAGGFISSELIGKSGKRPAEFLKSRYAEYFTRYDLYYAGKYKPALKEFKRYRKLNIPVGYARTTDIFPAGTEMLIRTLEGDARVVSDDNIYIMVGVKQEIYPIDAAKFKRSYKTLKGKYAPNPEFLPPEHYTPTVKDRNGATKEIDAFVHPCVTRGETEIYAKKLTKAAKVFTKWNNEGYMAGKISDYLAVRADDPGDIYIIESSIFGLTYKKA